MVACALLTSAGTAHAPGSSPTALIVALFSAAFAMGAWARAGLYCNHQVCTMTIALRLAGDGATLLAREQPFVKC